VVVSARDRAASPVAAVCAGQSLFRVVGRAANAVETGVGSRLIG